MKPHIQKALYLLNHLTLAEDKVVSDGHSNPVILKRFLSLTPLQTLSSNQNAQVLVKSLETTKWEGPFDLITWLEGMLVSLQAKAHVGYQHDISDLIYDLTIHALMIRR